MSNRLQSFNSVLDEIKDFSDEQLYQWLIQVLDSRVRDAKRLPTRWVRHAFVARVYRQSDLLLQARLGKAYSGLFESFVPSPKSAREPTPGDCEYLFNLVSLASTIRTDQVKARLRRCLYLGMYRNWEYDLFNLHNEILLATSAYDPDEAWLSHICETLPAKPYFGRFALAAYRAILQTQGIDCVKLLPQVLRAVDPRHEKKRVSFGYLLSITVQRFGQEVFLNKATEALGGAGHGAAEVCSNVLRLEDFIENAFQPSQEEQFRRCVMHLREAVLDPATQRLQRMEDDEKVEALNLLLERKRPKKIVYSSLDTPSYVFVYPRRYEIKVNGRIAASLKSTLDEYDWHSPFGNSPDDLIIIGRPPGEHFIPPNKRFMVASAAAAGAGGYPGDEGE